MKQKNDVDKAYMFVRYDKKEKPNFIQISDIKKRRLDKDYFSMFQEAMVVMSKLKLHGTCWSVFAYLSGKMDFENSIHIPQKQISTALGISQANVSLAIKKLFGHGILLVGPMVGPAKSYKLDCNICWKGSVKKLEAERLRA